MGAFIDFKIARCPVCSRNLKDCQAVFSGHVIMDDVQVSYGSCEEHMEEAKEGPDLVKRLGETGPGYRGEWCERLGLMAVVNTWKGDYEYDSTSYVMIC